jgi:soluble lytic murein transglycosylase-like protein
MKMKWLRTKCGYWRQSALRVLVPVGLIGFGSAFGGRTQLEGWDTLLMSAEDSVQTHASAAVMARTAVQRAWQDKLEEEKQQPIWARFARQYEISHDLARQIHVAATAADVDPDLAFRLVKAESSFKTSAVSPVGAVGLTQVMPATANWVEPGTTRAELMEPGINLRVGFRYLRMLMDQYRGNTKLALTAYNRGPGTVDRLLRRGRSASNGYAEFVLQGSSDRHVSFMKKSLARQRRS